MSNENKFLEKEKKDTVKKISEILSSASVKGVENKSVKTEENTAPAITETPSESATIVDNGWLENMKKKEEEPSEGATVVDNGWLENMKKKEEEPSEGATVIDKGWNANAEKVFDPSQLMEKATANYFANIEDFKNAASKITSLTSHNGIVYTVKGIVSDKGGESIVLLCKDPSGRSVTAKIFYEPVNSPGSSISSRKCVLEYMNTPEGKEYTLVVEDIGLVDFGNSKYFFEITPYCENGDLSKAGAFSYEEIVKFVKRFNEILHSIHSHNILHRDIKPHNLYITERGIVLGDFGTAKAGEEGTDFATSIVVGSTGYTAPELRLGITNSPTFHYTVKIDYYSFGITIATLFEGHFIYKDMDDAIISKCILQGKVPLRREDPDRHKLENLLSGLCKLDARYRFGYEEVCKWLENPDYTGSSGYSTGEWERPFLFFREEFYDAASLFAAFTKNSDNWEEGKAVLYGGLMQQGFALSNTDLARFAQKCTEKYSHDYEDFGFAVFLKYLYAPGPLVWKGKTFNSLNELGNAMFETKDSAFYIEMLKNGVITHWLENTKGISFENTTYKLVEQIEDNAFKEPMASVYWFANCFGSEKKVNICGGNVTTVKALIDTLLKSPHDFYTTDGHKKLINIADGPDLYGFLYSFGYFSVIKEILSNFNKSTEYAKNVLLFTMLEAVANKEGLDTLPVKKFFVTYGPVGVYTYIKDLVSDETTYKALDSDGRRILRDIRQADLSYEKGTVKDISAKAETMISLTKDLISHLEDNPHVINAGVYENRGIICTNLKGCFAYTVFGITAPIGFSSLL